MSQTDHEAVSARLLAAARLLSEQVGKLRFAAPVAHVYNPLDYAWPAHQSWLLKHGRGRKRVVFLGMNPGPFGMMQTGVPFGEVAAVRDWIGIHADVKPPESQHPKRPIQGFACQRSEVSGRRLWGWAAQRFGTAQAFFSQCFVLNYCPLVFLEEGGRNRTPEQLPSIEAAALNQACDEHLREALAATDPQWAIGIGGYAAKRLERALGRQSSVRIAQILHPSPASPAANRGWSQAVDRSLAELGVFH
ncbi:MAG: uracil-DNA glycosylase family protein [Quisquiliibacterium sp.]